MEGWLGSDDGGLNVYNACNKNVYLSDILKPCMSMHKSVHLSYIIYFVGFVQKRVYDFNLISKCIFQKNWIPYQRFKFKYVTWVVNEDHASWKS